MAFRRTISALLLIAAGLGGGVVRASDPPAPVFRVFLTDGTALASWGEYARVGDALILTLPVGTGSKRTYEFASIPVDRVDLERTEAYAEAIRAAQFAAARGGVEYAELRERIKQQMAAVPLLPQHSERVAAAESARQQVLDWAATSHGYQADAVQDLVRTLEARIIELRAAAGESTFSLNLRAATLPPAPPTLMAVPTAAETVRLAMKAAEATADDDVRRQLIARASAGAQAFRGTTGTELRAAAAALRGEQARVDRAYKTLDIDLRLAAARAAAAGDPRAVDALRAEARRADREYGGRRAGVMTGLLGALDNYYDAAALRRLTLDAWEASRETLISYRAAIAPVLDGLQALAPMLEAVQDLVGAPVTDLVRAQQQTVGLTRMFATIDTPEGAGAVRVAIAKALERAEFSLRARQQAVADRSLETARLAGTAAGEAFVQIEAARAALNEMLNPPKAGR
jgi:hypothetical protein